MQTEYSSQRDKFRKFNIWELNQYRKKSIDEKLQQFAGLFDLVQHIDSAVRERGSKRHLENLIWVQRMMRMIGTRGSADDVVY